MVQDLPSYKDKKNVSLSYNLLKEQNHVGYTQVNGFLITHIIGEVVERLHQIVESSPTEPDDNKQGHEGEDPV